VAAFEYVALDERGKQRKGILEADSSRQVRQQLRDKQWMPITVEAATQKKNASGSPFAGRSLSMSRADLAMFTRQLSTLIGASMPIEEALRAVAEQTEKRKVKSIIMAIRSKVLEGHNLATSFGEFPQAFPKLFRATVSAGENSGHLDLVLDRLADYVETSQESRQKVQLAAVYPAILLVVAVSMVVGLLTFVLPDIVDAFAQGDQELPGLTQVMITASDFLKAYGWFVLGGLIALIVGFRLSLRNPKFLYRYHEVLLKLPLVGSLVRGLNCSNFASTVAILNGSGVPLVEAMSIGGQVLGNVVLQSKVAEATQKVTEGSSMNRALAQTQEFPPMMIHMIASGESGGELDAMLERVAKNQETNLQNRVQTLVGVFEPVMLLVMAFLVLLIVMAIMLPIIEMSNLVNR
jgi:general secretion pathway protein F